MGGVERASRQVSERHRPLSSQTGVLLTAPFCLAPRGPQAGLLSLNPTVERRLRYEADLLMEDDINTATSESGEEDDEEVP